MEYVERKENKEGKIEVTREEKEYERAIVSLSGKRYVTSEICDNDGSTKPYLGYERFGRTYWCNTVEIVGKRFFDISELNAGDRLLISCGRGGVKLRPIHAEVTLLNDKVMKYRVEKGPVEVSSKSKNEEIFEEIKKIREEIRLLRELLQK